MAQDVSFTLPFPRPRAHPEAERARARHLDWVGSLGLVRGSAALDRYRDWRLTDLAGYAYPDAHGADLDLATDSVCLGFPLDDHFDGPLGDQPDQVAALVTELAAIPYRRPGARPMLDVPLAHAYADVWRRTAEGMPAEWRHRAAGNLVRFFQSYVQEARNRARGGPLDEADYLKLRRTAVGVQPCFDLIERVYGLRLPAHLYWTREVQTLIRCAGDVIFLCNDVHSAEREEARGEPHNLVLIRERARGCGRRAALEQVCSLVDSRVRSFLQLAERLPRVCAELGLGAESRREIGRYVQGLSTWMAANQEWGPRSGRYAAADVIRQAAGPHAGAPEARAAGRAADPVRPASAASAG